MEPTLPPIPKMFILAGIALIVLGLVYWAFQGKLNWLGRLPGDIRIEKENFRFYAPITTMILLSLVLNVLIQLVKKFL